MGGTIVYLEQHTDDVETLYQDATGENWEFEYLQLTPGPLGSRVKMATLPDLSIHWYRSAACLHVREYHQHDAVFLTFLLDASSQAKWYGRELDPEHALLYFPYHEQDYVLPRHMRSLGFMLRHRLCEQMGWRLQQTPLYRISQPGIHGVASLAADITRRIRQGGLEQEEARILQERLALRLTDLLEPWLTSGERWEQTLSPGRQYRLIELAIRKMKTMDFSEKLDIKALASHLDTSPRSLYRAFSGCFAIGPYEYFTLLRFRAFRRAVRMNDRTAGAITDAALASGFSHLGRFSALYREHYGELPRDSLQRWLGG